MVYRRNLIVNYGDELHYVGKTRNFKQRIIQHKHGYGANKTKRARSQDITFKETLLDWIKPTNHNESVVTKKVRIYCQVCKATSSPSVEGRTRMD